MPSRGRGVNERDAYRLLIEGITDYAIYMLDPDGRVASWNAGAQRFKGYTAAEIMGHHFSRFYTPEDRAVDRPRRALETARNEGRFEAEGWRLRKNGARFWAHVVIDPIYSPEKELIGYAKITRDLTERRRTQEALEQTQAALVQAQKIEALGQLTGGVAHDFNNLLSAVLGSLELATRRLAESHPALPLVQNAMAAARRGASLTQRLLAFARRQDLQRQPVDVIALVQGMADLLRRSIGPSIAIETKFPLQLPAAMADPNQLETALLNLAVNARDAMPSGGSIEIGAQVEALEEDHRTLRLPSGRYIRLYVTDTGEGMDEATLARATEPFFTTKGVGKGTGLGLSMVHGVAEQFGGRLHLKSRPGEGATAEIWLPISDEPPRSEAAEEARERPRTPPLRILAVDDDDLVLLNTTAMLEELGHSVLEANSGQQALELFSRERVDLVISDHAMPRMTGFELARQLRMASPETPIILASGYAELPRAPDFVYRRLSKPFTQAALEKAIADAVTPGGREPARSPA